MLLSTVLTLLGASNLALASPVTSGKESLEEILSSTYLLSNDNIVEVVVSSLKEASNSNDTCVSCVNRLVIGKALAITRPDLVPTAFEEWCKETSYASNSTCETNFARNTVDGSTAGSNFADMLQLMDPFGYDGHLYCHYKDSASCPKPATPNVSVSHMWPEKESKYLVAPEPSINDTFHVLHLSDFHVELDYTVGAEANCTDSMCCTPQSVNKLKSGNTEMYQGIWNSFYEGSTYDGEDYNKGSYVDVFKNTSIWAPATTFGNYQCDSPEVLINASLNSIVEYSTANNLEFEFTIFTGDLVDHDEIQYTDYQMTVESEEVVLRDMKNKLGSIPVYPVLGNHDSYPYGELAQEGYGFSNKFSWNAELMADIYENYGWLNSTTSQYARTHYTGFAVDTDLGLKVISLNSNCFYLKNHYCYWNATNPDSFGQWEFLINELVASEAKDQRVWIIAHIPPATDGLPLPSKIFTEIIERFSPYTIAGIFFGHTHYDQFQLLYAGSGNDTKTMENVINFAWISPSVTPYVGNNPSWRYYEVDRKTFSIMNGYNFYTQLNNTYQNNGDEPTWEFEYSSREGYNISWPESSPLNASYWHQVAEKVKDDVSYRQLYENYSKRWSPAVPNCSKAGNCVSDWCFLTSLTLDDYDSCVAQI